ncbi:hypothetical protein M422DRAFT_33380 [Sphaerobolus stellatus SS14]|uniref:Uncharacterized protein n=1 Tax=Sphaerobolus stellatus (strain SS14) TaxID=990650 RepID=A0A0C9VL18_SPHS4|nr:hypothetical protein M422DRAFT_33380 [Sphaerobolus stellatus SS14]
MQIMKKILAANEVPGSGKSPEMLTTPYLTSPHPNILSRFFRSPALIASITYVQPNALRVVQWPADAVAVPITFARYFAPTPASLTSSKRRLVAFRDFEGTA